MAQPVRRELLLQPRRFGRRGEDLADALVRDRDDPVVGSFPSPSNCGASQVRRPTRIVRPPCLP